MLQAFEDLEEVIILGCSTPCFVGDFWGCYTLNFAKRGRGATLICSGGGVCHLDRVGMVERSTP